ncbi:molybdopterin-guanine dinucleotide biosynthesis protein B [Neobacillus muris]|uniref:molybdopterin-guanine dinucleotide biosynthesis protein B n=1 Tax=Neobacillus muris TaxID=2941334 RepID=UPI0020425B41|nr:molybdopterin-guanine dinucleotide biosynthesis protein B [Neobacillus muris]
MALVSPVIFQVVGYQNSGKTTLIARLIQLLTEHGVKAAVIKHHGHGGQPDVLAGKDSARHLEAGAIVSSIEGGGRLILQADKASYSLENQIELLSSFHPDIIFVEGYKEAEYPKLLLLRSTDDLSLLRVVGNVAAIGYWEEPIKTAIESLNSFNFFIHDEAAIYGLVKLLINLVNQEG